VAVFSILFFSFPVRRETLLYNEELASTKPSVWV